MILSSRGEFSFDIKRGAFAGFSRFRHHVIDKVVDVENVAAGEDAIDIRFEVFIDDGSARLGTSCRKCC
jgi:hypothetical protein